MGIKTTTTPILPILLVITPANYCQHSESVQQTLQKQKFQLKSIKLLHAAICCKHCAFALCLAEFFSVVAGGCQLLLFVLLLLLWYFCCCCIIVFVAFVYLWLLHSICGTIVAPMFVGAHNFLNFVAVVVVTARLFIQRIRCASFQSQFANRFKL